METYEYSGNATGASPSLFSLTRGFEFFGSDGRLTHKILKAGPKGFKIVAVTSTGHLAGFVENDRTAVTLPQCGHADVRVNKRDFSVWPGDMVALGPSERQSRLVREEAAGVYRSYTILSPANWPYGLPEDTLYRSPDPKRMQLQELLRFSFTYRANKELVSERTVLLHEALVEDALIEALAPSDLAYKHGQRSRRYEAVVRRAERLIDQSYGDALSMPQIANEANVPLKTLQRAFKQCRGMTIRSYLARVRLDAMYRTLAQAAEGTSVTSAAIEAGLFHFGRASAAYLQRFGELPSRTLDRTVGRSFFGDQPSGTEDPLAVEDRPSPGTQRA